MKLGTVPALFALAIAFAIPAAAQESADATDFKAPLLTIEQPPNVDSLGIFSQEPTVPPLPVAQTLADTTVDDYRSTIKKLSAQRHQFVHIKLKSGKVLTGLLRDVGDMKFSLNTEALGGPSIFYKDIAEMPRSTTAVGTRIKQGAEWTGLIVLASVAAIVLLPLILTGVVSDC